MLEAIKKQLMHSRGYTIYYPLFNWYVDPVGLRALDGRSASLFTIKANTMATKLGSWTFYSHLRVNKDILDTLRHTFSPKLTRT